MTDKRIGQEPAPGPFITDAKGIGKELEVGGIWEEGKSVTLYETDPRMSVMARDAYTGELVKLDKIKVEFTAGTFLGGVSPTADFKLHCTSYEAFKKRQTDQMTLVPSTQKPTVQNDAIPQPAKVKDTLLSDFSTSNAPVCLDFKKAVDRSKKFLSMIHNRTDAKIIQGDKDGRSPGVMIQQGDGKIYMFDGSAKQYLAMDGKNVTIKANAFNTAGAQEGRSQFGFPAYKNPVNDMVPQGTILTPQPRLLPDILTLTNTLNVIFDMVDMIDICKEAVDIIKDINSSNPLVTARGLTESKELVTNAKVRALEKVQQDTAKVKKKAQLPAVKPRGRNV